MATKKLDDDLLKSPRKEDVAYDAVAFTQVHSPAKPSAPPADWPSPRVHGNPTPPPSPSPSPSNFPQPKLLPPATRAKRGLAWLTLKLLPYHALNFVLGTGAFIVVVVGTSLAGGLLPLCCLGIPIYFMLLQLVRMFVAMDIALANTITRAPAAAHWNVPDELDDSAKAVGAYELRIAPRLTRFSVRSTLAVFYFATIKFALGVASCFVVCMPFFPIASEIAALSGTADGTHVAGWDVNKFNLSTHPVWFVVVSIGYFVVGIVLMHVVARISRNVTRRVCCVEVVPVTTATASDDAVYDLV